MKAFQFLNGGVLTVAEQSSCLCKLNWFLIWTEKHGSEIANNYEKFVKKTFAFNCSSDVLFTLVIKERNEIGKNKN